MDNGASLGASASASAGTNGVATIKEDSSVNISVTAAGGTLTLSTGNNDTGRILVGGDGSDGYGAQVTAFHGTASMDVSANVNLAAKGAVTMDAVNMKIGGGDSNASQAEASAGAGGKAMLHARDNVSITGGTVSLGADDLTVYGGGQSNGRSVAVHAQDGGSASLDVSAVTTLKATAGALTLHADSDMSIAAGLVDSGFNAHVNASAGDAKATFNLNDSVVLSATGAVSLTAGGDMSIGGNTAGAAGFSASISAGAHASAAMNQTEKVSISAGGTLTIAADHQMSLSGADSLGRSVAVLADGAGAKAAYTGDGVLTLSANTIKLSASSMFVDGGANAASSGYAAAKHGGSATL
jgi:filamentous hemagglutinin